MNKIAIDYGRVAYTAAFAATSYYTPEYFSRMWGRSIEEGEVLLPVALWGEGRLEQHHYIPLKEVIDSKEGDTLTLLPEGKEATFTCRQEGYEYTRSQVFEEALTAFKTVWVHPPLGSKEFSQQLPLDLSLHRQMLRAAKNIQDVYKKSFFFTPQLSHEELVRRFERVEILGGSHGLVFKAYDKKSWKPCALKLSYIRPSRAILSLLFKIREAELSCHLTCPSEVGDVPGYLNLCELDKLPKNHFLLPQKPTHYTLSDEVFFQRMECADGTYEVLMRSFSEQETLAADLQIYAVDALLHSFGVTIGDDKARNIVCKEIDETTFFRGQRLKDFDYFKYVIEGITYYLPRPRYLLQRTDFDDWTVGFKPQGSHYPESYVSRFAPLRDEPPARASVLELQFY